MAIQLITMARSINRLRNKTGIVIFVGMAARLEIRHMAMAPIARAQKNIRLPENMIASDVSGVTMHP